MNNLFQIGIKNLTSPIILNGNNPQTTIAKVSLKAILPYDILNIGETGKTKKNLTNKLLKLWNKENNILSLTKIEKIRKKISIIKQNLSANKIIIELVFPYFREKYAPVSKVNSLLEYIATLKIEYEKEIRFTMGITIPVTSASPLSRNEQSAKTQRTYISLKLDNVSLLDWDFLIDLIETTGSCEIYPLLKRPDEKFVTEYSYENPKSIINIASEVYNRIQKQTDSKHFQIEVENEESNHNYNSYVCIKN